MSPPPQYFRPDGDIHHIPQHPLTKRLVEKLPKESTTGGDESSDPRAALLRGVSAELGRRLKGLWAPPFAKASGVCWRGAPPAWHLEVRALSFFCLESSFRTRRLPPPSISPSRAGSLQGGRSILGYHAVPVVPAEKAQGNKGICFASVPSLRPRPHPSCSIVLSPCAGHPLTPARTAYVDRLQPVLTQQPPVASDVVAVIHRCLH